MNVLSVAIVGAGNVAGGYDENKQPGAQGVYSHAAAYQAHGGFRLNAVLDYDPQRATQFAARWDVPQIAESLGTLCGMRHDVISVCTPDDTHVEIARELLKARCCSTLFVEKSKKSSAWPRRPARR